MEEIALSVDKMRYLHKLGMNLSLNSSMKWVPNYAPNNEFMGYELQVNTGFVKEDEIPAYTISDILKMFPKWQLNSCTDGYEIHVVPKNWDMCMSFPSATGKTIISAVYNIACILLRKELI